jgi:hypothetical protein
VLDRQSIEAIQRLTKLHDGECPTCHQNIKFYTYTVNKAAAVFLRAMAGCGNEKQVKEIDISQLGLSYSVRTQMTKLRLHGLIARVLDGDGNHKANVWRITRRGWALLRGEPIPKKTTVYNNQTLGHSDELITIAEIMSDREQHQPFWSEPATVEEARTYHDVREPQRHMKLQAVRMSGSKPGHESQEIEIDRLEVGKPIRILSPFEYEYRDIAAFRRAWRVV